MTFLGKTIITSSLVIFAICTLLWILTGNWQWFAGGATICVFSTIGAAVLSAETKHTSNGKAVTVPAPYSNPNSSGSNYPSTPPQNHDDWTQPTEKAPDAEDDPFSR